MVTTLCLNPCFDKTAYVDSLRPGDLNRLGDVRIDMGGKGLNVAVVAHRLSLSVQCLGIMGREGKEVMNKLLKKEGISSHFLTLKGRIRTNLKVISIAHGHVTEFNEPGMHVSEEDFAAFREMVKEKSGKSEYLVLTGSLPLGLHDDAYRVLMRDMAGIPCIVDTVGDKMMMALEENPFLIKPNLPELESTLARPLKTLRDIRDAGIEMIEKGAQNIIVSMGKAGALITNGTRTIYAPALEVAVRSTVGAGDAMVGGMLLGLQNEGNVFGAFKYGVAAGTASVLTEGTRLIRPKDFHDLLKKVQVQDV